MVFFKPCLDNERIWHRLSESDIFMSSSCLRQLTHFGHSRYKCMELGKKILPVVCKQIFCKSLMWLTTSRNLTAVSQQAFMTTNVETRNESIDALAHSSVKLQTRSFCKWRNSKIGKFSLASRSILVLLKTWQSHSEKPLNTCNGLNVLLQVWRPRDTVIVRLDKWP